MQYVLISVAIMAVVTYLPRMLPLAIFKKKITNPWVKSFLAYVPYAVLAAMTFPAILYATSSLYSALAGLLVALVLAYYNKSLLVVALASTGVVFVVEQLLQVMGWA
ncbi:MAG TPA: AzlD domain-containing protein [Candidatus Gallacutalibacter stercoravium]|nr:AzlD domain-containing protein [Candidatus Gallacutalibacter stercoravium]